VIKTSSGSLLGSADAR